MNERARPGLLIVYTGNGKGKTTAALGMVMRALGRGYKACVIQFIKGKWQTGERRFAATLPGLEFFVMGEGFTWESEDLSRDRRAAQAAWETTKQKLASGEHKLLVLDELTYCMHYGFLTTAEVVDALVERRPDLHVVVTGRHAPPELLERADLVTEMQVVKHPYERGIPAQPGVDY